jgi:hypothetical protein
MAMSPSLATISFSSLGPRPTDVDRGGGDEYVRFLNGLASNFEMGPSGKITEWGEDNIIEIRLFANGDAAFWLNGERIIEHSYPDLVETGLHEFILGTNSHVMSNHFRAAIFKRGNHFTEAELAVSSRVSPTWMGHTPTHRPHGTGPPRPGVRHFSADLSVSCTVRAS